MEQREVKWPDEMSANSITENQVHVWRISLDVGPAGCKSLISLLSADELNRVNRLHFTKDQNRFIIARAALRQILSHYLCMNPRGIRFAYTPEGKPMLMDDSGQQKLRFNLSHSGSLAICAVSWGREVGIDIEKVKPDIALEAIIDQFYSPDEIGVIHKTPEEERKHMFFQYWVRKEAFLKAIGKGLSFPLNNVDVSRQPGVEWAPVEVLESSSKRSSWHGKDLITENGYNAAIVLEHEPGVLQYFDFKDMGR
jgi:4'-phosphopantetheinyl transferase